MTHDDVRGEYARAPGREPALRRGVRPLGLTAAPLTGPGHPGVHGCPARRRGGARPADGRRPHHPQRRRARDRRRDPLARRQPAAPRHAARSSVIGHTRLRAARCRRGRPPGDAWRADGSNRRTPSSSVFADLEANLPTGRPPARTTYLGACPSTASSSTSRRGASRGPEPRSHGECRGRYAAMWREAGVRSAYRPQSRRGVNRP